MRIKEIHKIRGIKKYWKLIGIMALVIGVLNLTALNHNFAEIYILQIYSRIAEVYGRLTSEIPFALGEYLMYFAMGLLVLEAVLLIPFVLKKLFFCLFLRKNQEERGNEKQGRYKGDRKKKGTLCIVIYSKGILLIGMIMLLLYTLNWSIPFRYGLEPETQEEGERLYTLEELGILRDYIVEKTNECAGQIERDEDGNIIYSGNTDEEVMLAMQKSALEFDFLAGDYPAAKPAGCSDFLDWMGIAGYTYPYTMEVTYNKYTKPLYYPVLIAHEFSHHKGYYREDDANFISEIVCLNSESVYLCYSGCLDAYYYLNKAYKSTLYSRYDPDTADSVWAGRAVFSEQVNEDLRANQEIYEAAYAADEHAAQNLSSAAESVSEVGWNVQADILQEDNYDGVVILLLRYFDGVLYQNER